MQSAAVFHERAPMQSKPKLVDQFADKYGVDADKLLVSLKSTAFKQQGGADSQVSNEQMMMLLVVANEYNLNPFTREIYAFPSKGGGIVPIVSIDGWVRIVNEHPAFRGVAFEYGPPHVDAKYHGAPEWTQCTMARSDRDMPVMIREYLVECYRNTDPWNTTTARMLRHRAYIQCGRMTFGFALHDQDEAERIIEGESSRVPEQPKAITSFNASVKPPINGESTRQPDSEAPTAPTAEGAARGRAGKGGAEPPKTRAVLDEPSFTYAELATRINNSVQPDDVNDALSLVDQIKDAQQQLELKDLARARLIQLQE